MRSPYARHDFQNITNSQVKIKIFYQMIYTQPHPREKRNLSHVEKANTIQKDMKLKIRTKNKNEWSQSKNANLHTNVVRSG